VLDPGGYGAITITKAISIQGHGYAGISVGMAQSGVTIFANLPDIINLRGLIIDGAGVGPNGISFTSGQSLTVENCVIRNLTMFGIEYNPNTTSSLAVLDTFVANNNFGIEVAPTGSGTVTAVFTRVEADDNHFGIVVSGFNSAGGKINATAVDSVVAGNSNTGFHVNTQSGGATTNLMIFRSVAANNFIGVTADAAGATGATVWFAQSMVTGNGTGFNTAPGGVFNSYGDNYLSAFNGTNSGILHPFSKE
jgi:hypothetical protein